MTKLDAIMVEVNELTPDQQTELIRRLLAQTADGEDESSIAQRGLQALTESTRDEDWSEFYPPDLGSNNGETE